MGKLICIGEALIDFTSKTKAKLKDVNEFIKNPGGAPANVAVCCSKLGGKSLMITKLGNDAFGDYIVEVLKENNVNTDFVIRTSEANTPLAFVSLDEFGERDFSFYRNPSSDLLLSPDEVDETIFNKGDILHFCSVDLVDYPVLYAHKRAIDYAIKNEMLISFDPNLRFSLWNDLEELKRTVLEFLPFAHILKLSDDELEFITGIDNEEEAVASLFQRSVKLVIITLGKDGSVIYSKDNKLTVPGYKVKAVDTTGAGDAFMGSLLYQLLIDKIDTNNILNDFGLYKKRLEFSNLVASIVTTKYGAIPAMPSMKDLIEFKTLGKIKNSQIN